MMIRAVLAMLLTAGVALSVTTQPLSAQTITVRGVVHNPRGDPLAGVRVEVWRRGRYEDTQTHADGTYEITLNVSPQIDQIRYTRSDLDPTVIERLSGRVDQQIGKVVLYDTGARRPLAAVDEQLHVFEAMLIQAWTGLARDIGIAALRELNAGRRLAALPLPDAAPQEDSSDILDSLRSRKEQLLALYSRRDIAVGQ